jgi:lysophospholipase L1-like esterase
MKVNSVIDRRTAIAVLIIAVLTAVFALADSAAMAQTKAAAAAAASPGDSAGAVCEVDATLDRFAHPLIHTARVVASRHPLRIVAVGSSSTAGSGASTSAASYPSRLEVELSRLFPSQDVIVFNRGVAGEEAADMVARFETGVIAEKPDLVIWQVGTNSVLRGHPLQPHLSLLHGGIAQLKTTGADIVLIDPQYAPKFIGKPNADGMVALIARTAKEESVDLFERNRLMRRWLEVDGLSFDTILAPDQLHMNDWSYACLAKWLAAAIAEAATRPTETARGPRTAR